MNKLVNRHAGQVKIQPKLLTLLARFHWQSKNRPSHMITRTIIIMHLCLRVPELLTEITLNLSRPADISSLSRCDRMFRQSVMPLLFRNISIYLQDAPPIAAVLKNNPHFARLCNTFLLKGSDPGVTEDIQESDPFFDQLAIVLATLADQANVKVVSWCINSATYTNLLPIAVPVNVWQALGRLYDSLEQLNLNISDEDVYW